MVMVFKLIFYNKPVFALQTITFMRKEEHVIMRTKFEDYIDDEGRFMGVALENDYFEDKISEATYNIKDIVRTEGGLGSDERYVRKWLGNFTISYDLNEIYKNFRTSLAGVSKIEEGSKNSDFSLEADVNGKIKRVYAARAANNSGRRKISREKKDQIKSDLKNYLKSSKRRFR